jgi:hypothetical protein
LHNSGFSNFSDLAISGTTTAVISIGASSIILTGVNPGLLTADNFLFVP